MKPALSPSSSSIFFSLSPFFSSTSLQKTKNDKYWTHSTRQTARHTKHIQHIEKEKWESKRIVNYLFQMFVDPFCESFLLDCIAFICGERKRRIRKFIALVLEGNKVDSVIVVIRCYSENSTAQLNRHNLRVSSSPLLLEISCSSRVKFRVKQDA